MKTFKFTFVVLIAAALVSCGGLTKGKAAAQNAIGHFHDLYNQGKLDDIWREADPKFQAASTKQKYDDFMAAVRRKLGNVTATSNETWNVQSLNLSTRVLMNQKTTFVNGQGTESFTFAVDGTNATLVGYNIQSMDLIMK